MNKVLLNYFSNIVEYYLDKRLSSTDIMVLIYILSQHGTGKSNVDVVTLNDVETMFKLKKQRVKQIMNNLKEHGYVTAIYYVTTLPGNTKEFVTYNKARAFQKSEGGQVYLYGVKLVKVDRK